MSSANTYEVYDYFNQIVDFFNYYTTGLTTKEESLEEEKKKEETEVKDGVKQIVYNLKLKRSSIRQQQNNFSSLRNTPRCYDGNSNIDTNEKLNTDENTLIHEINSERPTYHKKNKKNKKKLKINKISIDQESKDECQEKEESGYFKQPENDLFLNRIESKKEKIKLEKFADSENELKNETIKKSQKRENHERKRINQNENEEETLMTKETMELTQIANEKEIKEEIKKEEKEESVKEEIEVKSNKRKQHKKKKKKQRNVDNIEKNKEHIIQNTRINKEETNGDTSIIESSDKSKECNNDSSIKNETPIGKFSNNYTKKESNKNDKTSTTLLEDQKNMNEKIVKEKDEEVTISTKEFFKIKSKKEKDKIILLPKLNLSEDGFDSVKDVIQQNNENTILLDMNKETNLLSE